MKNIAIVSFKDDFHSLVIRHALNQFTDVICDIIEVDRQYSKPSITWSISQYQDKATIMNSDGSNVPIESLDVIWWRRGNRHQQISSEINEPEHIQIINQSCYDSLLGNLYTRFYGTWISDPIATLTSSNKLIQMQSAKKAGFLIPETLVTQNPFELRKFKEKIGKVILKPVQSSLFRAIPTQMLTDVHIDKDESIMSCPVIYQQYIPGRRHLRVNCFGRDTHAVELESSDLDWRLDLNNASMNIVNLDKEIEESLYRVCDDLGLSMGIFDLKITPKGEIVWLEVNPQGQFLFIQGLTDLDLTSSFSHFLYSNAK